LASVVLIVCRELHFVHDGTHISVSLPTDTWIESFVVNG
jgi:hypothetical protein